MQPITHINGWQDIKQSLQRPALWLYLSWMDIVSRYRRTAIGPFWLVLSTFINITALGFVGASIFHYDLREFFPYIAAGMVSWSYLSTLIIEGCTVYVINAYTIQNLPTLLFSCALRVFVRNTIVLMHNLLVVVLLTFFTIGLNWNIFLILPAFLICALTSVSITIILGMGCARFRDVTQIVNSLLSVVVFVTPIIWKKELLGSRVILADINPFTHYVEILRAPLIGQPPSMISLTFCIIFTSCLMVAAVFLLNKFRHRVPFWV